MGRAGGQLASLCRSTPSSHCSGPVTAACAWQCSSELSSIVCAKGLLLLLRRLPIFPRPGWVGSAGVMSLCLPRKGRTKDRVPKDTQPSPQLGHWADPPLPTPFLLQKCLLFTRRSIVGDTLASWALCLCSVRFLPLMCGKVVGSGPVPGRNLPCLFHCAGVSSRNLGPL